MRLASGSARLPLHARVVRAQFGDVPGRQGLLPLGPRPGHLTAAQQTRRISVIRHHG